ncbi:S24 family peptidase [Arcobacteraceae bacterium]|nr:S24 family peptidase [Arcobacteraceae bacterium]
MDMIHLEYTDIFDENKTKELVFSKHLVKSQFNEKSLFPLIVDGKSMQPVINDKAVIVADLSLKELAHQKVYVVYYEEKMWIKKYDSKREVFVSINPDFSHLVYTKDEVHIVARVLLTFTNL